MEVSKQKKKNEKKNESEGTSEVIVIRFAPLTVPLKNFSNAAIHNIDVPERVPAYSFWTDMTTRPKEGTILQAIANFLQKLEMCSKSPNLTYFTECADYLEVVRTIVAQTKHYADVIESLPIRSLAIFEYELRLYHI